MLCKSSSYVQHYSFEREGAGIAVATPSSGNDNMITFEDDWFATSSSTCDKTGIAQGGLFSPFNEMDDLLLNEECSERPEISGSDFGLNGLSDDMEGHFKAILKEYKLNDVQATAWVVLLERFQCSDSDTLKLAAFAAKIALPVQGDNSIEEAIEAEGLSDTYTHWKEGKDFAVSSAQINSRFDEVSHKISALRDSSCSLSSLTTSDNVICWADLYTTGDFPFEEVLKEQDPLWFSVTPTSTENKAKDIEQETAVISLDDLIDQSIESGPKKRQKRQKTDTFSKPIGRRATTNEDFQLLNASAANANSTACSSICSSQDSSRYGNRKVSPIVGIDHDSKKPYFCKICLKAYSHHSSVYKHYQSSHEIRKFQCDTCGKTYTSRQNLSMHLKTKCNDRIRELEAENQFLRESLESVTTTNSATSSSTSSVKSGKFQLKL